MNLLKNILMISSLVVSQTVSAQNWTQVGADIDGEAAGDYSGVSVSISSDGSTVAIGAYNNDGNGSNAGHVRIYKDSSGTWTQQGSDIDGEAAGDGSGSSVSLSGDGSTVAIGADGNGGNGSNAGHVRIYKDSSGTWIQQGSDIDGEAAGDGSGSSVSLSSDGSTVAIGADGNDGNGTGAGHVRIYKDSSGTWTQQGSDIDGEAAGDRSGSSVSLSSDGSTVAIGANSNDGNGTYAGHVRVYKNISGTWTQQGSDIDGEAAGDYTGSSVLLSSDGSTVAVGASSNDGNGTNAGHVRVYKNISGTRIQQGSDIDGEAAYDGSGKSVSLSSDGSTVAIGAYLNDGNGTNAGHVRIYKNISGTWIQQGADIDGEAALDHSGWSVSLSSDGSTVAIGGNRNDGNGSYAGHVRIYKLIGVPIAINDSATTNEDTAVSVNVLSNDIDVDNLVDSLVVDLDIATSGAQDSVSSTEGIWQVSAGGSLLFTPVLDYNGVARLDYTIKDSLGLTDTATISILVNAINDAPDSIIISNSNIAENVIGSVGILSTSDVDANNLFNYSFVTGAGDNDNSEFTIVGDSLKNKSSFNYEVKNEYTVRVKSVDQGGLSVEQIFELYILNVNDIIATDSINKTYCLGASANGSIYINASETNGNVSFSWTGPNSFSSTNQNISSLDTGVYNLQVSDTIDTANFKFELIQMPIYSDLSICYVTEDTSSAGNSNRIYFNNPNKYNVEYIQIRKESSITDVYDSIGQVSAQSASFLDTVSNNQSQTVKYKVCIIDSCGNISTESDAHRTILLQANLSASNSVNLNWSAYEGFEYSSYFIYRSINNGNFSLRTTLPTSTLTYNDVTANTSVNNYSYFVGIVPPTCDFQNKKEDLLMSNIKEFKDGTTSINSIDINYGIEIYPNPTKGSFDILNKSRNQITNIKVFNSAGKEIINSSDTSLNLENNAKGVYIIQVSFDNGHFTTKRLVKY